MDFKLVKYIMIKIKICYPCLWTNHNKQYIEIKYQITYSISNYRIITLNQSDIKFYFQRIQIKKKLTKLEGLFKKNNYKSNDLPQGSRHGDLWQEEWNTDSNWIET